MCVFLRKHKKAPERKGIEEQKMPRTMKDLFDRAEQMTGKKKNKLKRLGNIFLHQLVYINYLTQYVEPLVCTGI
jgi:hypothetical protein